MSLRFFITRVSDGLTRECPDGFWKSWEGEEPQAEFMYTEGNYSCDCNRHLFFEHAGGVESKEDVECGPRAQPGHPAYLPRKYALRVEEDGKTVYQEKA